MVFSIVFAIVHGFFYLRSNYMLSSDNKQKNWIKFKKLHVADDAAQKPKSKMMIELFADQQDFSRL